MVFDPINFLNEFKNIHNNIITLAFPNTPSSTIDNILLEIINETYSMLTIRLKGILNFNNLTSQELDAIEFILRKEVLGNLYIRANKPTIAQEYLKSSEEFIQYIVNNQNNESIIDIDDLI